MVVYTTKEINGVVYDYAYSDKGLKLLRDGEEYDEANDPLGSGRTYTESSTPREDEQDITAEEALDIILGGEV